MSSINNSKIQDDVAAFIKGMPEVLLAHYDVSHSNGEITGKSYPVSRKNVFISSLVFVCLLIPSIIILQVPTMALVISSVIALATILVRQKVSSKVYHFRITQNYTIWESNDDEFWQNVKLYSENPEDYFANKEKYEQKEIGPLVNGAITIVIGLVFYSFMNFANYDNKLKRTIYGFGGTDRKTEKYCTMACVSGGTNCYDQCLEKWKGINMDEYEKVLHGYLYGK